jgi:hypothetical protein
MPPEHLLARNADLEAFRLAPRLHFTALLLGNRTFCVLSLNLAFPVTSPRNQLFYLRLGLS